MKDSASPLGGRDSAEYLQFAPAAKNDLLGSLFYFLRNIFSRFCQRLKDLDIHFRLLSVDARELLLHLGEEQSQFDSIEASAATDSSLPHKES